MDQDTANLIRELCTRAGMIMEDASVQAVCVAGLTPEELAAVVVKVSSAGHDISALADAAMVLARR